MTCKGQMICERPHHGNSQKKKKKIVKKRPHLGSFILLTKFFVYNVSHIYININSSKYHRSLKVSLYLPKKSKHIHFFDILFNLNNRLDPP